MRIDPIKCLKPVGLTILLFLPISLALLVSLQLSATPASAADQPERCNPNDPDTCRSSDDGQGDRKDPKKKKPQSESPPQG
jgi:hypothetical protein